MPNLLNSYGRTKTFVDITGLTIVNLSGSQSFTENIIFPKGTYSVEVVAGSSFCGTAIDTPSSYNYSKGVGGKVITEITIGEPFIVRAYCGSKGNYGVGGVNPYSGIFKESAKYQEQAPVYVSHIFGNVGGSAKDINSVRFPGGGNCLGDGAGVSGINEKYGIGAGSCLHFLPVNGVFGTDYLFAAHCCAAAIGSWRAPFCTAGCGSAYGGSGAGYCAMDSGGSHGTVWNGGSTPYGNGGTAVVSGVPANFSPASGTGVGAGLAQANVVMPTWPIKGAAAYYNGNEWVNSGLYGNLEEDGHIIVKCIGYL